MASPELTSAARRGRVHVLTLAGDLTAAHTPALRTALIDGLGRYGPHLVLDLSAVTACDESTARVFEEATARAWRRGGWVRLAAPTPAIVASLQAIYGTRNPGVYPTVEEAMSVRAAPRSR